MICAVLWVLLFTAHSIARASGLLKSNGGERALHIVAAQMAVASSLETF
jgi:hypothetical protein